MRCRVRAQAIGWLVLLFGCSGGSHSKAGSDASTRGAPSTGGSTAPTGGAAAGRSGVGGAGGGSAGRSAATGGANSAIGGSKAGASGGVSAKDSGAPTDSSSDAEIPASDAATELPGWKLVWSDEFDGAAGDKPSAANWVPETGGNGWGNNELEFYTDRTANAALDGKGALVITASSEAYMGRNYTSARLKTQGKFEHAYGRFEARVQIPRGQGIWPAFWMLGNDIGSASWPACGEIDIMENVGKEPSTVHGTIHGPGYSGGNGLGAPYKLASGAPFADAYHVFAIEWETNAVRFYVDGNLYETRTPADLPKGAKWVYDHPFFIILNVAVGGQWPGNPDSTTMFPQRLLVDYVRVYDKAP